MTNVIRQSKLIIQPNMRDYFALRGNFIRLLQSSDPVRFFVGDSDVTLDEGEAIHFDEMFDRVGIEHSAIAALPIVLRIGMNAADISTKIGGAIIAAPSASAGASVQSPVNVTNASIQILAANAARKYLRIQNRDAVGFIYINLSGAVATVGAGGNGIELPPGCVYESTSSWITTSAITAIGSIPANANVLVVEGQ